MYRLKFYFGDGTIEFGGRVPSPEKLYYNFDGLMDWDEYYELYDKKLTPHQLLEMAMELYKYLDKEYSRIEIVNDETGEVVDYIDEREVKNNGKK